MKSSLILTTFNRPQYLSRCLDSLLQLTQNPDILIIIDDCSTDDAVRDITASFIHQYEGRVKWYSMPSNGGIKKVLKCGIEYAIYNGLDVIINLDPDAVVRPEFISRMIELKAQHPGQIVSGFNSKNTRNNGDLRNPVLAEGDGYAVRATINGINMCFSRDQYTAIIEPALRAGGNWDQAVRSNYGFIHAVPSLVQHIGLHSSMGHDNEIPDYAHDFKTVQLPDVTLFGIDAHDPKGLLRAAEISLIDVEYGDVALITAKLFSGREAYSKWIIEHLHEQFTTSHVLIIHPDGYVLNPQAWRDEWLQYDYIGAAWEWHEDKQVGNGGFCLRSKRFCELSAQLYKDGIITETHPEDDVLCRLYRHLFEDAGMKFAPVEVARKFSIEAWRNPNKTITDQFGFHGKGLTWHGVPAWQRLEPNARPVYPAVERYMKQKAERKKKRMW